MESLTNYRHLKCCSNLCFENSLTLVMSVTMLYQCLCVTLGLLISVTMLYQCPCVTLGLLMSVGMLYQCLCVTLGLLMSVSMLYQCLCVTSEPFPITLPAQWRHDFCCWPSQQCSIYGPSPQKNVRKSRQSSGVFQYPYYHYTQFEYVEHYN